MAKKEQKQQKKEKDIDLFWPLAEIGGYLFLFIRKMIKALLHF